MQCKSIHHAVKLLLCFFSFSENVFSHHIQGMACVGRTKECTIVPSNHYGPVPGVPVGTTWKFRVQVSSLQITTDEIITRLPDLKMP